VCQYARFHRPGRSSGHEACPSVRTCAVVGARGRRARRRRGRGACPGLPGYGIEMRRAALRSGAPGLLAGAAPRPAVVHDLPLELVRYPRQLERGDLSRDIAADPGAPDGVVMRTLFLQAPSFEG